MFELFVLGCTGVVVFLHGANFFFHALTQHLTIRSLWFETSEMAATFLASMPLVRESWRLCAAANAADPMGFDIEISDGVGYLAFSGVQPLHSLFDPTWEHVVPLETARTGIFGPLVGHGGGNGNCGDIRPAVVHAGLLQPFLSMLNSQSISVNA